MESYKRKIRSRVLVFAVTSFFIAAFCVFEFLVSSKVIPFAVKNDILFSFPMGFLIGIWAVELVVVVRSVKALKDPKKLQMLENAENDERKLLIRQKAGMPIIAYTSLAFILCGIAAGFFSMTIFYTLVAAAVFQLMVSVSVKLYYTKTLSGEGDND